MYRPQSRMTFGPGGPLPTGIKWLIISNAGVFLLQSFLGDQRVDPGRAMVLLFGLVPPFAGIPDAAFQVWQPITYLFLHSTPEPWHVAFNMLMLWMFGTSLERQWGARAFLRYYFVCGIGAALLTLLLGLLMEPFRVPTIGASGAVFGLLLAFGYLWPNRMILIWGIIPMRARTMVLVFGGLELYSLVALRGEGGIAYSAHVGGMLVGYLYLKRAWRLGPFLADLRWKMRRRRFRVMDRRDDDFPFH